MATYVLIPGAASSSWYWCLLEAELSGRGHEVVAVDLPCDDDSAGLTEYTQTVVDALIKNARKLPQELYKSLTWDRGKELASHKRFTLATDIQVYFCDPRSPWQRGSNENTNGLLRQYMPKGIDISSYSQAKLNAVARQLNERPRKTLGYQTPAQKFDETVALTS